MKKTTILLLHLNGWLAVLIGSFIVFDPVSLLSSYGLQPDPSIGLLSELRAPGGLLIVCGLMILRCALDEKLYARGLQLSIMIYGGYGAVRLLGIVLDGQPPIEILIAAGIELTLCGLSLLVMWRRRQSLNIAFDS